MAFCSFSSELVSKNSVLVDNVFINEFLPHAPESCVKVYLFGLYNCNNLNSSDNSLASFARILNLSEEDIESAFAYWESVGLVQVLNSSPVQVRYLPVKKSSAMFMKFNKDKYADFNVRVQDMLSGRMINPTEYNEYYYLMESMHIEPEALLKIVRYCVDLKGENVGYKYITTVAKNWAYSGITTAEKVDERLYEQEAVDSDLKLILKELGTKRAATVEEYELFLEWTDKLGFELESLIYLAKYVKKKRGGITRLDGLVNKFYAMRLMSVKEIEDYQAQEEYYYIVAKEVCKNLGVRYDNLEVVVETYISGWLQFGFELETLVLIAKQCFITGIKTLQGMNDKVNSFYKFGLITQESLENHLENNKKLDEQIVKVLEQLGILRYVNKFDRAFYNTWVFEWNTSEELLTYAISQSVGKVQPMQYLNKLLSVYHSKNIKDVESAQKENVSFISSFGGGAKNATTKTSKSSAKKRDYSPEELNALFTSIEEVQI